MKQNLKKVICLMGPTASGKTDLAIHLTKIFPCDIISVDSAMVYRGLNIGSAKPSAAELSIAPHRLIDIRDPDEPYSAADFRKEAICEIDNILAAGRIPLLVGGTMLYFKALQQGLSKLPAANQAIREKLLTQAQRDGWQKMHDRLREVDPVSANRIHPNDPQRLQRALEVYEITGKPMTEFFKAEKSDLPYEFINIALLPNDRKWLHERIERRFRLMLDDGLLEEVKQLIDQSSLSESLPALRSVGCRQVLEHLNGEYDQQMLLAKGVAATRQLAKRQITWLRRWPQLQVFACDEKNTMNDVVQFIIGTLDGSLQPNHHEK